VLYRGLLGFPSQRLIDAAHFVSGGGDEPHLYDYEYFYVTFDTYGVTENRRSSVDVINEMERATNSELVRRLGTSSTTRHLNEYKGVGYVQAAEREARGRLMTPERLRLVTALVDAVMEYVASF